MISTEEQSVYISPETLKAALRQLRGTAHVYFRLWLTIKQMGFGPGRPPWRSRTRPEVVFPPPHPLWYMPAHGRRVRKGGFSPLPPIPARETEPSDAPRGRSPPEDPRNSGGPRPYCHRRAVCRCSPGHGATPDEIARLRVFRRAASSSCVRDHDTYARSAQARTVGRAGEANSFVTESRRHLHEG